MVFNFANCKTSEMHKSYELRCCLIKDVNRISAKVVRKGNAITNMSQEDLDIKCLQLLRAMVHNEERKLPDDWDTKTAEHKIKTYVFE